VSAEEKWRRLYRREDTPEQIKQNIDAEFESHLELRIKQLMEEGLSEEEAKIRAQEMLGDRKRAERACRRTDQRWLLRDRAGHILGSLATDVGYALRMFRTSPLFALMACLCMAVGITFTAVTYTFLDRVFLNQLPFEDADELVMVGRRTTRFGGGPWTWLQSSFTDFEAWQRESRGFQHLATFNWRSFTITDLDNPVRVSASEITDGLDEVLGVNAVLGRTFTPGDFGPGAERVALLGHDVWQRFYGGDPSVVGRLITLNGEHRHRVVGIMPPRFTFPDHRGLWIPFPPEGPRSGVIGNFITIGRLRDGVAVETAQVEMTGIAARMAALRPEGEERSEVRVVPFGPHLYRAVKAPTLIIFIVGGLVLLLACANLASLMLSRAASRSRELGVRVTLGAGRGRLIQQLLVESLVIALVGGVVGALMGRVALGLLLRSIPVTIPEFIQLTMDGSVLMGLAGIVVASGVLFGLAPCLSVRRGALGSSLRSATSRTSAGKGYAWVRSSLVVVQIALATVVLSLTGIVVRGYIQGHEHRMGIDSDRLLAQSLSLPSWAYPDSARRLSFFREGRDRLEARAEVEAAAYVSVPPGRGVTETRLTTPEMAADSERSWMNAGFQVVSPGYLATVGIPLFAGRDFTSTDLGGPPVALVNASLARLLWPGEDPLGREIFRPARYSGEPGRGVPIEVVGVVGDVRHDAAVSEATPGFYLPLDLSTVASDGWLIVRTARNPASLTLVVRETLKGLDPRLPVGRPQTIGELVRERNWLPVMSTWMLTVISAFALVLALVGIVGVVAYSVSTRMREFGIRLALGAEAGSVLRSVLVRGALMACTGIAVGTAVAFGAMRFVASVLVNTQERDPVVLGAVFVLLALLTILASYLPARRVIHIDPVEVLREE
jgi:predicted permease